MTTSPEPDPPEVIEGPELVEAEPTPRYVGSRREARERAISLLYEAETRDLTPAEVVEAQPIRVTGYASDLVLGVGEELSAIDAQLGRLAREWDVDRMPSMDRAVLRLACFELIRRPDIPTNVVLNEAVELAKAYGTDDSGRFVNGLLSQLASEVRG